jgi:hypothetical protein
VRRSVDMMLSLPRKGHEPRTLGCLHSPFT